MISITVYHYKWIITNSYKYSYPTVDPYFCNCQKWAYYPFKHRYMGKASGVSNICR